MLAAPWSWPKCCTVLLIQSLTADESRTSRTVVVCLEALGRLAEVDLRPSALVSARAREAPRVARRVAVARPMPLAAPVTAI